MNKYCTVMLAMCSLIIFSCQSGVSAPQQTPTSAPSSQTTHPAKTEIVTKNNKERSVITYACHGFYNGIASEFIEMVWMDTDLIEIWYWNTQNDDKIKLKLRNVGNTDDEIGALFGEVAFPSSPNEYYDFVLIEDYFRLMDAGENNVHEFEYESSVYE